MTVFVPGMSGESLSFYAALQANPEAAADVRFAGVHFPGVNRSDYLALHPRTRQRGYFMTSSLRRGMQDARAELLPLDYPGIYRDLAEAVDVDIAIAQVSPPDQEGRCSLGACIDFLPAVWKKARQRWVQINPRVPRTRGSIALDAEDFDAVFEQDCELLAYRSDGNEGASAHHAALVASLVRDGDTLEFGIGKLPNAILAALGNHRALRIHSGLITDAVAGLVDAGAIRGEGAVEAGVALGDAAFYARVGADDSFYFRPVSETHDVRRIGAIANFCAINSAVEVDLFGQVNADSIKGRLLAGVGGLPAFASGARLSTGGRSIVALPAITEDGAHSRIVPALGAGCTVALARHEADYVVTEHGIAALRGLSLHARAKALIAIAAPQFQEELARHWHDIAARI
ncbi:MAG: Acyl coenzyme hydrolase/transferase [Nevskia sp.]|nr:Acyl coenzyme hydrolase/transferase [Nevskia sp.]